MESTLTLELTRLDAPLGVEVHGLDAREVPTPEVVHALKQAVAEHGVLVLRGQQLGAEAHQVAFTEAFGETVIPWLHGDERGLFFRRHEIPPRPGYSGWHPSCNYMVNSPDLWDNPDDGFAEDWHADVSYLQSPMPYSFLFALEAPDQGYQTAYWLVYHVW